MSAFSRSASGLENYHRFHGADFIVFVEGKAVESGELADSLTVDVIYYECLLAAASRGMKPKVKCVGNKETAFGYARKIREAGVKRSVVVVDKDLEGLTSSALPVFPVIRTFGYSWECELWSSNTVTAILCDLTNAPEKVATDVARNFPKLIRRLKYLSLLDAASQVAGFSLLSKKTALCGVAYSYPFVSVKEISRHSAKFKASEAGASPISGILIKNCMHFEPCEVIQGHFWSNMVMRFVAALYRSISGDSMPSNSLLTRLALSHMRRDPANAVGATLVARYSSELIRVGILA